MMILRIFYLITIATSSLIYGEEGEEPTALSFESTEREPEAAPEAPAAQATQKPRRPSPLLNVIQEPKPVEPLVQIVPSESEESEG